MTARRSGGLRNVTFLDAAIDDLRRVNERSRAVVLEVFRMLKEVDAGRLRPTRLRDFAKTGDLGDCRKLVVALEGEPEYRIVVIDRDGKGFTVIEVVAVEQRLDDLAYLLAGLRLGRIADPVRRSDTMRRIDRVRRTLDRSD